MGEAKVLTLEMIEKEIEVHEKWTGRLVEAIRSGSSELPIADIRSSSKCEFGAWLFGAALSDAEKNCFEYSNVVELHAHFHNIAGRVVEMSVGGNKVDAEELLTHGFYGASNLLIAAMEAWKEKLRLQTIYNTSP